MGDSGRPEEAEPLFRRVIAIETERFGADHPEVAASLQALGRVLADLNRGDEAMAVFDTALAIYDRLPAAPTGRSPMAARSGGSTSANGTPAGNGIASMFHAGMM